MIPIPEKKQFGEYGIHHETGTTAVTGDFYAIYIEEAATFTTLTAPLNTGDAYTGYAIQPGWIFARVTAFTLSSGKVTAYKNPPA